MRSRRREGNGAQEEKELGGKGIEMRIGESLESGIDYGGTRVSGFSKPSVEECGEKREGGGRNGFGLEKVKEERGLGLCDVERGLGIDEGLEVVEWEGLGNGGLEGVSECGPRLNDGSSGGFGGGFGGGAAAGPGAQPLLEERCLGLA